MRILQKIKVGLCCLLIAALLPVGAWEPVFAESGRALDAGVIVTNNNEFLAALANKKSPVIIRGVVTVSGGAEASGRMLPIRIPQGTVIRGENSESALCSRAPIQLEGDGVMIQDIMLQFVSSNALGSVVHREIYLAGHSLTLDHVGTYREGMGGSFGDLGGTEKELLPTVYAGGYSNTSVGANASLTVRNTERELEKSSIFQGIFMGHEAGRHGDVPYKGTARLELTPDVIVRDGIYTNLNASATVKITGSGTLNGLNLYGNGSTTLLAQQSILENAFTENIGTVILDENARLVSKTCVFYNITLKNNACLDFNHVPEAFILGDFQGADSQKSENPGILVLDSGGAANIEGDVAGQTILKAANKDLASIFNNNHAYIFADQTRKEEAAFLLSDLDVENGWALDYADGAWVVAKGNLEEAVEIGSIEISASPSAVDIRSILDKGDGTIPDEEAFCQIIWRDLNGEVIPDTYVGSDEALFYDWGYVIGIKTDCWESDDPSVLEKEDWGNSIWFQPSGDFSGKYYFCSNENAFTGDYTFLFCSRPYEEDLVTAADVKALKDTVKAECRVTLFDSSQAGETPPTAHMHTYESKVTEEATCEKAGKKIFTCTYDGCGESYIAVVEKTAHMKVEDLAVMPTCTSEGKTAGSHCGVCGAVIKAQRTIPKTAHTEVTDPAVAATCIMDGKTAGSHCGVCNTVITAQEIVPKTGNHVEETDPAVDATCTSEGKTEGSHCSVCNTVIKAQEAVPMLSHDYEEEIIKEATCSEAGEKKLTCQICGDSHTEEILAIAHTPVTDPAVDATCTSEGKTEGIHCSVCNAVIKAQETISMLSHDYEEEIVKKATCSGAGEKRLTCQICGDSYTETIAAIAHDYKTQTIKATVSADGRIEEKCSQCQNLRSSKTIPHPMTAELSYDTCSYSEKAAAPAVTVRDSSGRVMDADTYTVSYKDNKKVGIAKAEISFRGVYEGTLIKTFTILPKAVRLSGLTPKRSGILVKWKKQAKETSGYLIQYSENRKFKGKTTKTVTVSKAKTVSKTVSKLKSNKKYFVRIRAFKTVKINGKKTRLCSEWSKAKAVKTK